MITAKDFVYFIAAGVFGSLVKFPFMPIFVAGLMYLVVVWWRTKPRKKILAGLVASFKAEQRLKRFVLVGLLVLSIGLFIERYGVNYALYHRQEPRCEQIRSKSECMRYGPWARNYSKIQQVATTNPPYDPPVQYFLPVWTNTLVTRAYFAINHNFETRDPLPLPFYTAIVVGTIGLVLSLVFWRRIIAVDRHMLLLAAVIVLYLCALMQTNFGGYLNFHIIDYGVNGRYLILILPFLFIWLGLGFYFAAQKLFKKHAHSFLVLLSVVVLALTLNGGGWQTFLLRSEPFWFWENTAVREVNSTLKHIISPLVIGSNSK